MGIIKLADGDVAEAAAYFRQALAIDPDSLAARRNLEAAEEKIKEAANTASGKEKKCENPPSLF